MKKYGSIVLGILAGLSLSCESRAQQWNGSGNATGTVARSGDLTVIDGYSSRVTLGAAWGGNPIWGSSYLGFNLRRENNATWSYLGTSGTNAGVVIYNAGNDLAFSMRKGTGSSSGSMTDADVAGNVLMRFTGDGKLVVGKTGANPTLTKWDGVYKLYVEDGILTERVRVAVKTSSDWADYVFDKDYKMMPLPQLKKYIQQNKHLPDVPSAQEVVKQGVDLQRMDAKLLQKVEELTLYMLQQQQEIQELKNILACKGGK